MSPAGGRGSGRGTGKRRLTIRVRTAKGRKASSTRWLQRQLNDPYVAAAGDAGYRSRAAFKLLQLDDKTHFFKPGQTVVDLGAAPGGWTQIAVERIVAGGDGQAGRVVAVDISGMEPLAGAEILKLDLMDPLAPATLENHLGGPVDVVLSDMAAPATGHRATDHLRSVALCEAAADFATSVLAPGGVLVVKVLQGGTKKELLARLKRDFEKTRHIKPKASRKQSSETYLVAAGFRGRENT